MQLTAESQNAMLMISEFVAGMTAMKDSEKLAELEKLTTKHGAKKMSLNFTATEAEQKAEMTNAFSSVKDKPGYFAELMNWTDKNTPEKEKNPAEMFVKAELQDLKIDGDSATAQFKSKQGSMDRVQPIEFKKIDGVWFIQMPFGAKANSLPPIEVPQVR